MRADGSWPFRRAPNGFSVGGIVSRFPQLTLRLDMPRGSGKQTRNPALNSADD